MQVLFSDIEAEIITLADGSEDNGGKVVQSIAKVLFLEGVKFFNDLRGEIESANFKQHFFEA